MSNEMQSLESAAEANEPTPGLHNIAGAGQISSLPEQHDTCDNAEDKDAGFDTIVDESDPVEVDLVAQLEALLAKDVEVTAAYKVLLSKYRETARERHTLRTELRLLHTEQGGILLVIKVHRARKGRGGAWAEFLRQRKPKALSRTTADRWIAWYLASLKPVQVPTPPAHGESENAPKDESGAFSAETDQSAATSRNSEQRDTQSADEPPSRGCKPFEDVQQLVLVLKRSQAARLKAAAEFLIGRNGSETSHEAIYLTVVAVAASLGFEYPVGGTEQAERSDVSERIDPGTHIPAERSKAA
jgi:hypothetical protein